MTKNRTKLSALKLQIFQLYVERFKRRNFSFITRSEGKWHRKQDEALGILTDDETREFLYGGAAGGSKSWTGAAWLLFSCLAYPDTKWFIGRESLKRLRDSTLITMYKVANAYGIPKELYSYNGQDNYFKFANGSRIDMLDLRYLPRDPLYERYGSVEYTGGWVEEGGEVHFAAFDTLKTRVGRHLNDKYGILPIIFVTCNPKKNWMYSYFYKPSNAGILKPTQRFLQAFVQDNPFIESTYLEQLESTTDKSKRERLLKGNWDYDDNPYKLCDYDRITDIFTNEHIFRDSKWYITADIARYGSDKAVIGVWHDWELVEMQTFDVSATTEIQWSIQNFARKYQVPKSQIIADADGVGGGVVDNLNIIGFVNNARPFPEVVSEGKQDIPKYRNLQTQMLVYLAEEIINKNKMYLSLYLPEEIKENIKTELDTIERIPDADPITLTSKEEIKKDIGHSPDYRDMILMRAYFDFAKTDKGLSANQLAKLF